MCGDTHEFNQCLYLMPELRTSGWKPDAKIQKTIDEKLENKKLGYAVKNARKTLMKQLAKNDSEPSTVSGATSSSSEKPPSLSEATHSSFAVTGAFATGRTPSNKLLNCWTLDSGTDIHVSNDPSRFKLSRMAEPDDILMAGKSIYPVEEYEIVDIVAKGPDGPVNIRLLEVALIPGFFTNLVCLNKFMAKGVHWNTEKSRLHQSGVTFCHVEPVGGH